MGDIAHIRDDGKIQTVEEHCLNVAKIASKLGKYYHLENVMFIAGLLHDCGKFSEEFQEYIQKANAGENVHRGEVNHSSAGGIYCDQIFTTEDNMYQLTKEMISYSIISHHGLNDCLTLDGEDNFSRRLLIKSEVYSNEIQNKIDRFVITNLDKSVAKKSVDEINYYFTRIQSIPLQMSHDSLLEANSAFFLVGCLQRLICSILIDADRRDTSEFMSGNSIDYKDNESIQTLWNTYSKAIEEYTRELGDSAKKTKINELRSEISKKCKDFADKPTGIYKLEIPTGGGKTISSMRYAIHHASKYSKKHIIYVAPFLSILEQNASVIRSILHDDDNILEHHSNFVVDDSNGEELINYQRSIDLWDSPVILTTMVRLLDVLFSDSTQNIRRFHQLSNSVIIFDEVQSIPIECINMFNTMVNFLSHICNSTIILCTATQPSLDQVPQKLIYSVPTTIIQVEQYNDKFKRVKIVDYSSIIRNSSDIANLIQKEFDTNMLVILNTKSAVKKLYELCKKSINNVEIFQLTTYMCAEHRLDTINKMKSYLNQKKPVLCISTNLIEAGVDISFKSVIRSLAGYDSIIQAAGRCNRNNEMNGLATVYLVDNIDEKISKLKYIFEGKQSMQSILYRFKTDLLVSDALIAYYNEYYMRTQNDMNYHSKEKVDLYELLSTNTKLENFYYQNSNQCYPHILRQSFKTAGSQFSVIDGSNQIGLIVDYGDSERLIHDLQNNHDFKEYKRILKKLQRYTVNINESSQLYKELESRHAISMNSNLMDIRILDKDFYDLDIGITTQLKEMIF